MGRFISGDWSWKFAFGDQSSSFGKVLEDIFSEAQNNYVSRFVGTCGQGEYVELNIDEPKEALKLLKAYIKGFKEKNKDEMEEWRRMGVKFGDEYWNRLMIKKFIKDMDLKNLTGEESYNFYVEY